MGNIRYLIKKAYQLGYKEAARKYEFQLGSVIPGTTNYTLGNGIVTASRGRDYDGLRWHAKDINGKDVNHAANTEMPTITRLRQADGSVKYRVSRRLDTDSRDRVGRIITDNFSVVVDNPRDAMRLAKGKVSFDPETLAILSKVRNSKNGTLSTPEEKARTEKIWKELGRDDLPEFVDLPKRFGLIADDGVADGIFKVQRNDIQAEKPNRLKMLKRWVRMNPGKSRAIATGSLGTLAAGSGIFNVLQARKNRRLMNRNLWQRILNKDV